MAPASAPSRETRLLLVTIAISIAMLLVLARFRFPQRQPASFDAPAAPLERLAARATYDELATILRTLDETISDSVFAVRVDDSRTDAARHDGIVPAVRLPSGRIVALLGRGRRVLDVVGGGEASAAAIDAARGVAVLNLPSTTAPIAELRSSNVRPAAPGYLAAIEGTEAGPAVRPMYFGRVDSIHDPRWSVPLLRFSALQQLLPYGAVIFTLEGRLLGLGFPDGRDLLLIPAEVLEETAGRLATDGSVPMADLGVEVQSLDAPLAEASGTASGVIVNHVQAGGPGDGAVRVGDVVASVGQVATASVGAFQAAVAALHPGERATLQLIRGGVPTSADLVAQPESPAEADTRGRPLGLQLRPSPDGSEVLQVHAGSAAAVAGLRPGDVITAVGGASAPAPADVERTFARSPSGAYVVVGVERGASHLVVAVRHE